jgi:sulfur-carrier protein
MIVRVKLFAIARQLAEQNAVEIELAPGATVGELRSRLVGAIPRLAQVAPHLLFAVNLNLASDSAEIPTVAEVACIPPVSGG